jgi:hypothetical protein
MGFILTDMNLVLKTPDEPPYEAGKDLKVVILGEKSVVGDRACEVLKLIELKFKEEEGRLIHQWWDFDFLAFDALRELAAAEAALADIVIIGIHNGRELPGMVTVWLKRWLDLRKTRPGALVAVLDSDLKKSDAAQGTISQLKKAAAVGHMDFFATRAREGRNEGVTRRLVKPPGSSGRSNSAWRTEIRYGRNPDCRVKGNVPVETFATNKQPPAKKYYEWNNGTKINSPPGRDQSSGLSNLAD